MIVDTTLVLHLIAMKVDLTLVNVRSMQVLTLQDMEYPQVVVLPYLMHSPITHVVRFVVPQYQFNLGCN